jgi:hypothetical protein
MDELNDDATANAEFAQHLWALQRGLPGAREALDAFHDRRHAEWEPFRDQLPRQGTVVVCEAPGSLQDRLAAAPVHHVNGTTGEEWGLDL